MKKRGRLIVVEGLEGAGKSTIISTIKSHLSAILPSVLVTREPGGTHTGETIRDLIKGKSNPVPIDSRAELLLLYAARVQLVEEIIRPALDSGQWVLADRFELSTFAYQGGGRGLDKQVIDMLSNFCLNKFQPDLILFLDIKPEIGLKRVQQRGALDLIEQESLSFFTRVYESYHEKLKTMNNVAKIDANRPLSEVQENVLKQLDRFLSYNLEVSN